MSAIRQEINMNNKNQMKNLNTIFKSLYLGKVKKKDWYNKTLNWRLRFMN